MNKYCLGIVRVVNKNYNLTNSHATSLHNVIISCRKKNPCGWLEGDRRSVIDFYFEINKICVISLLHKFSIIPN